MQLFPDQVDFVERLRAAMRQHQAVLAHAATGFGKTVVSAYIAQRTAAIAKRMIFAVHRQNLVTQTALTFSRFGIEYGFIAAGRGENLGYNIQIASIETLRRRLRRIPRVDVLYIDEAHLACSRTWSEVIDHFRQMGAFIVGNTATPERLDGRPLSQHFQTIVSGPPVRQLIESGRLSDYRLFAPSIPDLSGVHTRAGDYVQSELEQIMDTSRIIGDATKHYPRIMAGKRAIAFCVSIRASRHTADRFNAAGIPAAHIDGETPQGERQRIIRDFADGRVQVLCNVELITTGFDLSSQVGRDVSVEAAIMLRPTQSLALWLQMLGRALRAKPYPAIISDHTGCSLTHGLPDQERRWSLDGRKKKGRGAVPTGPSLTSCPSCFAVYMASSAVCPLCGQAPVRASRNEEPEEVDGELREVNVDELRRKKILQLEEVRAQSLEDWIAIARDRGHKPAWAGIRWAHRAGKPQHEAIAEAQRLWREQETAA